MELNVEQLRSTFERRGFQTAFFATKEEATAHLVDTVKGELVGFGGSMTLREMGLYDALSPNNDVVWHWVADDASAARRRARDATVYILSANGVAETGQIVNIDGAGNRVATSLYGPQRVIYVIGNNKVAPTLEAALDRARTVASPKNAARLGCETPCAAADGTHCFDCQCAARICNAFVVLERPCFGMQVELVFVDEELGY